MSPHMTDRSMGPRDHRIGSDPWFYVRGCPPNAPIELQNWSWLQLRDVDARQDDLPRGEIDEKDSEKDYEKS